ncbi:MAG TPA: hypothetical protein GX694_09450, partial [Actinomycetales bacterium]|nr:hypothetical protein [Actinomycetales bacterium]
PPTRATDVADGDVARTVVDPRLLLAAALAAAVALVAATVAVLRATTRPTR